MIKPKRVTVRCEVCRKAFRKGLQALYGHFAQAHPGLKPSRSSDTAQTLRSQDPTSFERRVISTERRLEPKYSGPKGVDSESRGSYDPLPTVGWIFGGLAVFVLGMIALHAPASLGLPWNPVF